MFLPNEIILNIIKFTFDTEIKTSDVTSFQCISKQWNFLVYFIILFEENLYLDKGFL